MAVRYSSCECRWRKPTVTRHLKSGQRCPVLLLGRNDEVLADDHGVITFERDFIHADSC
jgi:hypothetical protein